ncbi:BamA/TamA family outer membrane protein [uncultured Tateyamaria sp.]|uniref:BamA/TamA family outer membrane protein n=1 Tax=uncultured Tateyamaria sp. TaxID=455651 RepID=UPI002617B4BC|nr:BamA/TamA family outer membrane protein [uncultured Tateyamaria sp.]
MKFRNVLAACALATGIGAVPVVSAPEARVFTTFDVRGNDRFRDEDVIATSGLRPGVPVGEPEIIAAVEALDFTGEFKDVRIFSRGDTLVILVDEAPGYSGGLTFALGHDSDDGFVGQVGLSLKDPFGPGTAIDSNLSVADEVQKFRFTVRGDQFWGGDRSGGVRFGIENFAYDNTSFDYAAADITAYLNLALAPRTGAELRYTLATDEISSVDPSASNILQEEDGNRVSSGVGFSLIHASEPSEAAAQLAEAAWSVRFDQDFTGLGGNTDLSYTKVSFYGRVPLTSNGFALRTRVELGHVTALSGDDPTAADRFFLGGANLRGFERATISPRDICEGCGSNGGDTFTNLGGNTFAVARTDLLVPLFPKQPGLETFLFGDIGSAWSVDTPFAASGQLEDDRKLRSSYGIGVAFRTPLGIFESYYAVNASGEDNDEEQAWGLTFRAEF